MLLLWNLSVLVAFLCSRVLSEKIALTHGLANRQIFSSISLSCTGTLCSKTSSSSLTSSSSSSKALSSSVTTTSSPSSSVTSKISTVPSTTSTSSSASYNSLMLTTTFTQPPACTGGFTAIQDWGTQIFNNLIYSQSGFDLGYTSCFPPQFYSSVLAMSASTTVAAFNALICPYTWENYDLNSTYVICCPRGYNLIAPNLDDTIRPGDRAVCSSAIGAGALLDITTVDSTGGQTVVAATAGDDGTIVWANAFDGLTTTIANLSTSSSSLITTKPSSISSYTLPTTTISSSSVMTTKISSSLSLSEPISTSISKTSSSIISSSSLSTTTASTAIPGESALPACGQLCFNNMLDQYSTLGCAPLDSYCLCSNVNFGFGLRDCSNGACGSDVASTVIAFGSAYCSSATATNTATATTAIPGESALPACGQLCFNNMLDQYSTLGCAPLDSYCLCSNVNFEFGLRDCSNGACGSAVASTVISFGSAYCATATATYIA